MAVLPSNPEILDAAGRAHQAAGETNQALSIYGKLASIQPGSAYPLIRISEVQSAAKNKEGAAESLKKAMNAEPDSVEAKANAIMLHLKAGRTQEALDIARGIQKQRPKDALGYAFEGDIHAQTRNWKDAVKAYRAALDRTPSTQVAMKLHVAHVESGSKPAADQFASKWLADHAADRAFRAHIAQFAIAQRDYKTAAQHYRTLLEAKPDDAMVLNNLAYVESKLKDPKAVEHARKAHQLAPKHPGIMDTLGLILLEQGDTAGALDLLRKASAMAPGAPGIRLNLAKALIKAGQKDAARRELEELSKLGSKFPGQAEVAELKRTL
jgi:putative PEP-CTERM system TPR-repeat lipoprotein